MSSEKSLDSLYGKVTAAQYNSVLKFATKMGKVKLQMDGENVVLTCDNDIGYGDGPVDMKRYVYEFRPDGKMRLKRTTAPYDYLRERKWH